MGSRASTCVLTFLLLASCAVSACDTDDTVAVSLTGPSTTGRFVYVLTVAPPIIAATSGVSSTCQAEPAFDLRVDVNVRARQAMSIRSIRFEFFDASHRRVLPIPFPAAPLASDALLPFPTTQPIPFPGEASMPAVIVPAGGSFTAPFRLQFDCGVQASGTLIVSVEAADANGTLEVSRVSVQIGG